VIVFEEAAAKSVAGVICAGVVVVTRNERTDTRSVIAMVSDGAGVAIVTIGSGQRLEEAPRFAFATVRRTFVAVVAASFVHRAVTVVVYAVAAFL